MVFQGKNKILKILIFLSALSMPLLFAATGTGTVGITISQTNQMAVYTSNGTSDSTLVFNSVTPAAGSSITVQTNYTSNMTGSERGYVLENQGNVNISINVTSNKNAAQFIGGTSPAFSMWGENNETSSCTSGLVAYGSAFALSSTTNLLCSNLNFVDTSDAIWAYIYATIPSDAPVASGTTATITFTSTAA
ncbi:hypothetical protein FJZ26_05975 [Candidatus Parvarchaeota archaeon]|nr:hypothetical protein [Candidatus Parvarchaeota archaeon]